MITEAKIVACINQKGGVGKSTICHNVAAFLGKMNKPKSIRQNPDEAEQFKVLLIDNDSSGDLTKLCGFDQDDFETTTANLYYHADIPNFNPDSCIYETNLINVDLIPSNSTLTVAARRIDSLPGKELILKRELEKIKGNYDFIIIDNGPTFGTLAYSALACADAVIVPVQTSHLAVEDTGALEEVYKLIHDMGLNDNLTADNKLLVATLYNSSTKDDNEALAILKQAGCIACIPQAIAARKGYKEGLPVAYIAPSSKVGRAFAHLTRKIVAHFYK